MRVSIKSIGILSAFKVGCLMAFFPFICIVLALLLSPIVVNNRGQSINITGLMSLPTLLYGLVVGVGTGLVFGFQAALYNLVAKLFGGLEVNLKRPQPVQQKQPEELGPVRSRYDAFPENISPGAARTIGPRYK